MRKIPQCGTFYSDFLFGLSIRIKEQSDERKGTVLLVLGCLGNIMRLFWVSVSLKQVIRSENPDAYVR